MLRSRGPSAIEKRSLLNCWSRRFAWALAIGWTFSTAPVQAQKFGGRIQIFRPAPAAAPAGERNPEAGNFAGSVTLPYDGDLRRKLEPIHRQLEAGQHVEAVLGLGGLSSDGAVGDFFLGFDPKQGTRSSFKGSGGVVTKALNSLGSMAGRSAAVESPAKLG